MKREPSWKPRRKGLTYCSPACGSGCTYEAYNRARTAGYLLASSFGAGWKVRVWENMGWFYEVISPCGQVTVGGSGFAEFRVDGHQVLWETARTPRVALRKLRCAMKFLADALARSL